MEDNVVLLHPEGRPETEVYADFLSFFLRERMESTAHAYFQDISYLADFLNLASAIQAVRFLLESHPLQVNQRIQAWKASIAGLAPNTINRRLATIRSLLGTARSLGLTSVELAIKNAPGWRVKDVRGPDPSTIAKMLEQLASDESPIAARDLCIVYLAYSLGLRRKEISSLNVDDVDLKGCTISIMGKGCRRAVLSLPICNRNSQARWLSYRRALGTRSVALFINLSSNSKGQRLSTTSIYRIIRSAGERAGSPLPVRPHGLRRAAINEALSFAGVRETCQFSRHKDIRSLQEYMDPDERAQAEISEHLVAWTEKSGNTGEPGEQSHETK